MAVGRVLPEQWRARHRTLEALVRLGGTPSAADWEFIPHLSRTQLLDLGFRQTLVAKQQFKGQTSVLVMLVPREFTDSIPEGTFFTTTTGKTVRWLRAELHRYWEFSKWYLSVGIEVA